MCCGCQSCNFLKHHLCCPLLAPCMLIKYKQRQLLQILLEPSYIASVLMKMHLLKNIEGVMLYYWGSVIHLALRRRRRVRWLSLVMVTSALTQVKTYTESRTSNVSVCKSPQFDLFEPNVSGTSRLSGSRTLWLERRKRPQSISPTPPQDVYQTAGNSKYNRCWFTE